LGITVQSVEVRDVRIPAALEDAMSRKAQAEREKLARIILAESEVLVANEMAKAAEVYEQKAHAMQLRAMNMTYESVKERGALMVIPSGMADSMNTGVVGERVPAITCAGHAGTGRTWLGAGPHLDTITAPAVGDPHCSPICYAPRHGPSASDTTSPCTVET
jgi:hypothetical protein